MVIRCEKCEVCDNISAEVVVVYSLAAKGGKCMNNIRHILS
jgi:hypothetical protein